MICGAVLFARNVVDFGIAAVAEAGVSTAPFH